MKNAKTAIQVLLTLTCSKTHLQFFSISQNDFEWSRKINKYCYNKQSASGINPIGVFNFQLVFALVTRNVQLIATTLGYKLVSSLFWGGGYLLSFDLQNENCKNHKHIFSTSWAAEFANFSKQSGRKQQIFTVLNFLKIWGFKHFFGLLMGIHRQASALLQEGLAGLESSPVGSRCVILTTGLKSEQVCSTFKNIGICNFVSTNFRTQPKNGSDNDMSDTCNAYEWLTHNRIWASQTNLAVNFGFTSNRFKKVSQE